MSCILLLWFQSLPNFHYMPMIAVSYMTELLVFCHILQSATNYTNILSLCFMNQDLAADIIVSVQVCI